MFISKTNSAQSFKGVYFSKVDQSKLTNNEKAGLMLLGEAIVKEPFLEDYDFDFGKVEETDMRCNVRRDIFVKVSLDGDEDNSTEIKLSLVNDYRTTCGSVNRLTQAVYDIKQNILRNTADISLTDFD